MKGYAMIVGPEDTPYYGGFYFFVLDFPANYPFSPPKVTYMTNNGFTRFNPNLYTCGRVCVSILNTWHGEKWSACQTITTVLLALCSLLNDSPLENEPEKTKTDVDYEPYQKSIEFMNIDFAICDMICQRNIPEPFSMFYPFMKEHFLQNYEKIMEIIKTKNGEIKKTFVNIYRMITEINYVRLEEKMIQSRNYVDTLEIKEG
jgi:ubiquitin-conjugating enzyme E2 Z